MQQDMTSTRLLARAIRADVLRMVHAARASHAGSCLSIADILAVLYGHVLNIRCGDPKWRDRDRFILSKGHAAAALYSVLANSGFFPKAELETYCREGSRLTGHVSHVVPGVEMSSGSLGHGLSVGLGMAMAARMDASAAFTYVLLSDGECDEGAIWEAALYAGHAGLGNLVALIDYNKIQSFGTVAEVLELEPFADKWRACRWGVQEINGHDHDAIVKALSQARQDTARPSLLLCHTIKGKGVSYMENRLEWHYKSPDESQLERALAEVSAAL